MRLLRTVIVLFLMISCSAAPETRTEQYQSLSRLKAEEGLNERITLLSLRGSMRPADRHPESSFIPEDVPVLYSGLDVIELDSFRVLKGRNFALLTNATGLNRRKISSLELMIEGSAVPSLLLEPEHGLYGHEDSVFASRIRRDTRTGIPVLSLYSRTRKPTAEDLKGIDLIVIDIFNLPVRAYTYASTLIEIMESAQENGIEIMILDRWNPYGIWEPSGPMLRMDYASFVGMAPVPFLYSLTLGELAQYLAVTRFTELNLTVVKTDGYIKKEYKYGSGIHWINPSPNIPAYDAAIVYPGVVLFEGTNVSLGRGTTRPFIYSGAPWVDSGAVLRELRKLNLPDVNFSETVFRPNDSLYKGQVCRGIQITPTGRRFDPLRTGYEYMSILKRIHPESFVIKGSWGSFFMDRLWGGPEYRDAIESGMDYGTFSSLWKKDEKWFREHSAAFRLY